MKHTGSIIINKPIKEVTFYFANPDFLKEYQDTFIRKEVVQGIPGAVDTVSKMYYTHGKGELELIETITKNDLPSSYEASYNHIHMDNTMKCEFTSIDQNSTRYNYEYHYTRINWVTPKLIAILFPNLYRKPAEKWLNQFKHFVENQ